MKKDLRKVGDGENLNNNTKRLIKFYEEEHEAEEEIKEYLRQCNTHDRKKRDDEQ